MNILIGLYEFENFYGGVQTWTLTMLKAFSKMGFNVEVHTHLKKINRKLKNIPLHTQDNYDLIICNSNVVLDELSPLDGKKLFISHGILPKLEQPVEGADLYAGVSEEVADNLIHHGFKVDAVIRNPIDVDKFYYAGCSEELKKATILDRRRKFAYQKELKKQHLKIVQIGHPPIIDIRKKILDVDLVIGRGRGAYESMAMGKNVIISGNNSGRGNCELMDGMINSENFYEFRLNNCSGRRRAIEVHDFNLILKEIRKYDHTQGKINRDLIRKNNHYLTIAEQIISLARL